MNCKRKPTVMPKTRDGFYVNGELTANRYRKFPEGFAVNDEHQRGVIGKSWGDFP